MVGEDGKPFVYVIMALLAYSACIVVGGIFVGAGKARPIYSAASKSARDLGVPSPLKSDV